MSEFVEVNAAALSGAALDWAVAIAEGWESDRPQDGQLKMPWLGIELRVIAGGDHNIHPSNRFNPSSDWSDGGPLIEKYQINLEWDGIDGQAIWWKGAHQDIVQFQLGNTPLIAACRAIVASVLGETVSVPKVLLS